MQDNTDPLQHIESTLICGVPCSIYGSGDNMVCVRQSDGAAIPLKQSEAYLLSQMSTAKTIGDWLETLCCGAVQGRLKDGNHRVLGPLIQWISSSIVDVDEGGTRKLYSSLPLYKQHSKEIASLMDRGLVSPVEASLQAIIEAKEPSVEHCRITTLCIPTCGRAKYLARCVSSFSNNLRAHGRDDAAILVIDDSADRASEAKNREVVTSLQKSNSPLIRFVGYEERQTLINALLSKNVAPPEVIRFALDAEKLLTTEGSVRNTMMLLTRGQYILQSDDDTFCAYASANASEEDIVVSKAEGHYQTYFYPDRESNLKDFPTSFDIDPFLIHESVLGQRLSNVLAQAKRITWEKTNPHELASAHRQGSRVDITTTGASGDPGMGSYLGFITFSPEDTLKRIYSSPEAYRWATEVREIARIAPKLTISQRSSFMAMSFGINNTRLQPPFFSLGRNLDGVFAFLYRISNAQSLIGHLPFAISHLSEPDRRYLRNPADQVNRIILTEIVRMCLASVAVNDDASLSQNLLSIGEQLVGIGSISRIAFRSFLRNCYIYTRFKFLEDLQDTISERQFKEKRLWLREMESISSNIRLSMLEDQNIFPADLAFKVGPEESLLRAQSCILMYGKLMLHWESISDAATQICPSLEFLKPSLLIR